MRGSGGAIFRHASAFGVAVALGATSARAVEIGSRDAPLSVEVHAFASQGFILTTGNDYIDPDTTHGSFRFSEVGLNVTKSFLAEKLRLGVQIFAQNLGPAGNFNAQMDWFYLDYRWQDWLGFRAGRLKIPYGFYNEVNDIDSARVPILLPQGVYPLQARNFLFAQNGAELYGFARSPSLGAIDYRLYGGTIFIDPAIAIPPGSPVKLQINVPYVVGGRLFWEPPVEGLRVGGTLEALHLDATAFVGSSTSVSLPNDTFAWLGSAEYAVRNLALTAEYGRGHTSQGTSNAMLQPPLSMTSEAAYGMVTYRAAPWFQPGAYYSVLFPDVHHREGRSNRQHDVALTLRFDIGDHWLVKLEGHYMAGTAGLANPLRVGPLPSNADRYWGAFLVKTTGYF
jgi:hypothetical protein